MGMKERVVIKADAKDRIKAMKFGDEITNVCAGEGNPRRHAYFCKKVTKTKSMCGVPHTEGFIECTDKKGNFWKVDFEVIFAGHLDSETCKTLFEPFWAAHYS